MSLLDISPDRPTTRARFGSNRRASGTPGRSGGLVFASRCAQRDAPKSQRGRRGMAFVRQRPPGWFWGVAALLAFWGLLGCYFCARQFVHDADAMGPADAYQRSLYAALPGWYYYDYAIAT